MNLEEALMFHEPMTDKWGLWCSCGLGLGRSGLRRGEYRTHLLEVARRDYQERGMNAERAKTAASSPGAVTPVESVPAPGLLGASATTSDEAAPSAEHELRDDGRPQCAACSKPMQNTNIGDDGDSPEVWACGQCPTACVSPPFTRASELRNIASSIEPMFPSAADLLRGIAREIDENAEDGRLAAVRDQMLLDTERRAHDLMQHNVALQVEIDALRSAALATERDA